jgi:diguanylate cyclase (GGDEF)-like protein
VRFRPRLALFLVTTLVAVQALTAALLYQVTRHALIGEGERQLALAGTAFARQLDDLAGRVADNVEVVALDYPLRAAIAERDRDTVRSVLRNHGRRVGAERMLLLGLDGEVEADTADGATPASVRRAFAGLAAAAIERRAATVAAFDGRAWWLVAVPVRAPQPIALIGAAVPIDDARLADLQRLAALPHALEVAQRGADGRWRALARGSALAISETLPPGALPATPGLRMLGESEHVVHALPLAGAGDAPIAVVLAHSLDDALRPYRPVMLAWTLLLAIGLVAGVGGAWLIARGVSRPVEALADTARRIEAGDYAAAPVPARHDELGQLAAAFGAMAQAIGEREERIRYQAGHDAVTGLPHRAAAEAAIQQRRDAAPDAPGALLMIGIARAPDVVKSMGHAIADRLMHDAAERLRRVAADRLAARAAEWQFLVWLPGAARAEAIAVAFALRDALGEPYQEAGMALDLAPAVGIALAPMHGRRADELLRHADVALFAALGAEEPVGVYEAALDPHRPERLALIGELREAIDADQLELMYQPRLDLAQDRIDGGEGLVRWHHPRLGLLAPDLFVPLAESSGNVRRLTRWALAAGVAQAQRWGAAGHALRVAINLSARDLSDADLPRRVAELLAAQDVPPERILLEITESAVMGEASTAIAVLKRLADQGIAVAIDDFGVGQSSLAYLRRLPVRELKIDKSFVQKLAHDADDRLMVRTIVELAHRLGLRVTSEGVEDGATLDYLRQIGCDHAQGYYLARPLPVAEFDAFLVRGRCAGDGRPFGSAAGRELRA